MNNKTTIGIALGKQELELIDNYSVKVGLSRSALVRYIINNFFLNNKENFT